MPWLVNSHVSPKLPPHGRWPRSRHLTGSDGFVPWDLVACLAALQPELFGEWELLAASFPSSQEGVIGGQGRDGLDGRPMSSRVRDGEPFKGDMVVRRFVGATGSGLDGAASMENDRSLWAGVVLVPHLIVGEAALLEAMLYPICAVPLAPPFSAPGARLPMLLGALPDVLGVALAAAVVVATAACMCRRDRRLRQRLERRR